MSIDYNNTGFPINTYQLVITPIPSSDSEPPPNYSADVKYDSKTGKQQSKSYQPKNLSNDLYLILQLTSNILLLPISPTLYLSSAFVGLAKPVFDWKTKNIVTQKLSEDANAQDFGKMSRSNKSSYFALGLLFPVAFAHLVKDSLPLFSYAIVGLGSLHFYQTLSQKVLRWINPPVSSS